MLDKGLHEAEIIRLISAHEQCLCDLHLYLVRLGFLYEDDFYILERKDSVMPWQTEEIMTIDIYYQGFHLYESEEEIIGNQDQKWDELKVEYLLATLPENCMKILFSQLKLICAQFGLSVHYESNAVTLNDLEELFKRFSDELEVSYGGRAGSENLAMLIEQQY